MMLNGRKEELYSLFVRILQSLRAKKLNDAFDTFFFQ